jgi:hypothetical protein
MLASDETATVEGDVNNVVLLGSVRDSEMSGGARLPRSALALLAYLLLEGRGERASREEAGAFLWENVDRAARSGNLRQLLFRIRAAEAAADMRLLEITPTEIVLSLRAMGYRKLSARPRHHAQAAGAIEDFKKVCPSAWRRSGTKKASSPTP